MYLINISSMNTCDAGDGERADVVIAASFVVTDLSKLASVDLQQMAVGLEQALRTAPIDDIQPMSVEEVTAWRKAQREDAAVLEELGGNAASVQLHGGDEE